MRPDSLSWTSDSRYVLFSRWNETNPTSILARVPVAGGEPAELGLEMEGIRDLRVSKDGRQIAFTSDTRGLGVWVMENFLPKNKMAAK